MSVAPDRQNWVPIIGILLPLILGTASTEMLELVNIAVGGKSYQVELARTPGQRQRGLMYRSRLDNDHGMLLFYPEDGSHRIWMKNMQIPITVYWIDAEYRVIHLQRLEPCLASPCPSFGAPSLSRYVLELNDSAHGIKIGDRVHGLNDLP